MKIRNKTLIIISSILVFIAIVLTVLQLYAKNYVKDLIAEKIPSNYTIKYVDLDINIALGNITLHEVVFKIKDKEASENYANVKIKSLEVNGIGYWDLAFNETLSIKNILLKNPKFHYYPYKHKESKKTKNNSKNKEIQTLDIRKIAIKEGSLHVMRKSADSIKMTLSSFDLIVLASQVDLKSSDKMPFVYENYQLDAQKIDIDNGKFDKLKVDALSANKETLTLTNFQIIPKYSKRELSKHLKKERDHISLKVPKIVLEKLDFDFDKARLGVTAKSAEILQPNLEIYRDKLIADDLTEKALYSKSLRNLSFDISINQIKIKKGYISYAELVEADKKAGKLFFDEVDATLNQISNLKNAKKTTIKVQSKLMGTAPLTLNWNFDVQNTADDFSVTGSVSNLEAQGLNLFFKPNLNALAEGTLQQMYFSFYGNNTKSQGEMKMKYEDFNFKILQKNNSKVNKFLTAVGNIFIRSHSKTDPKNFRFGAIEAERDATKSFFNYLWLNVKSGVLSTLTGNGKKSE